ncbi:hypothetical protein BDV3_003045 [Batrachochytrium dendrobatidis]|nr:hypothetical protein O5D80_004020 [Batrachochytrium dendrobatidis]KAJ8330495.1 hypothetical protein O5D80_001474 [Batrachochytrium dendrobatidis]
MVKPEDFKSHIITKCELLEWAEKNNRETKGKRYEDKCTMVVLSPNSMRVDAYSKYPSNKVFELQSILTINSFRTCKELPALEDLAAIQQNVRKTEFVQSSFDREDEDSKSYVSDDEFFGGLVQHPF